MAAAIKIHCNTCDSDKNHNVLHKVSTDWDDDVHAVNGGDIYTTLQCAGCDGIVSHDVVYEDFAGAGV